MPKESSIIDTSRPNAGRIYDYLLGGSHNFEVDRQAADQFISLLPFLPKAMRLQRWCLQDIAKDLTEKRGFNVIVDFASGLPTNDHMHTVVPKDTLVIYSDRDPVVVEYAHEILAEVPNAYYFQGDARRPEELLNRPEVQELLKGRRDIALMYWGVSIFLADEDLAHAAKVLHEWAGPTSYWAFQAQGAVENPSDPNAVQLIQAYERMGSKMYYRPLSKFMELLQPWHPDEQGFVSLLDWHGLDESVLTERDRNTWGRAGGNYGGFLVK